MRCHFLTLSKSEPRRLEIKGEEIQTVTERGHRVVTYKEQEKLQDGVLDKDAESRGDFDSTSHLEFCKEASSQYFQLLFGVVAVKKMWQYEICRVRESPI